VPALPPPVDVGPVPAPATLVATARFSKPNASLATLRAMTNLPVPLGEQAIEMLLGDAVGPIFDLDQPIDFAMAIAPDRMSRGLEALQGGNLFAIAIGVKNAEAAKTTLAEHFKLVPADNDATLVVGLGRSSRDGDDPNDDDTDFRRTCELAPAYGASPMRVVCSFGDEKALKVLGPWLTRGATRLPAGPDLHVDFRFEPVRGLLADQSKTMGALAGSLLASSLPLSSLRDLVSALVADVVESFVDLDSEVFDVDISETAIRASGSARFATAKSTIAKMATASADRIGPPPTAFWQMPAGAAFVGFGRGLDDKMIAHARELVLDVAAEELTRDGVKPADRKALLDAAAKVAVLPASVYAAGFEIDALARAIAGLPADPDGLEARRWAIAPYLFGWHVSEVDVPGAEYVADFKELATALSRPSIAAALRPKLGGVFPTLRAVGLPKSAMPWPKDAAQYVIELPMPNGAAGSAATAGGANAKVRPPAPKPLAIHLLLVPDGARTWVGLSADEAVLVARVNAAMAGSGDTLGSRTDLAPLKAGPLGAGGFVTLAGITAEFSAVAALVGTPWKAVSEPIDELGHLPHHGSTPIFFTSTASATPTLSAAVSFEIPRGVFDDVVAMVARHGGF